MAAAQTDRGWASRITLIRAAVRDKRNRRVASIQEPFPCTTASVVVPGLRSPLSDTPPASRCDTDRTSPSFTEARTNQTGL